MRQSGSRSAWLASIGWCLAVACCGCVQFSPRSPGLLQAGRSLVFDEVPGTATSAGGPQDCPRHGPGAAVEWPSQSRWEPETQGPPPGKSVGLDQADSRGGGLRAGYVAAAGPGSDLGGRLMGACGDLVLSAKERMGLGHYLHPQFHPVPVRPVFSPCAGMALGMEPVMLPAVDDGQVTPPGEGYPQIEMILPGATPEEIPPPEAEERTQGHTARLAGRQQRATRPGTWTFNLALPR